MKKLMLALTILAGSAAVTLFISLLPMEIVLHITFFVICAIGFFLIYKFWDK